MFEQAAKVRYSIQGNVMQIAVPRSALGLENENFTLYLKAADSIEKESDIMDYYVSGESVPLGRLSFTYQGGRGVPADNGSAAEKKGSKSWILPAAVGGAALTVLAGCGFGFVKYKRKRNPSAGSPE